MTEKLYYQDAYLKTFTARIIERLTHEGHPGVVLDRTAFYPASGGQPNDRGKLNDSLVLNVIERDSDSEVLHILSQDITSDEVIGEIDWVRRFDLMQQHTGQHILSEAFIQAANAETVGFHLTDDNLTIDVNKLDLNQADVDCAEDLANEIVFENRPVIPRFVTTDELAQIPLRKSPQVETDIRVVEIEGFDWSPCGGTHVAHTGQVGLIKIVRLERQSDVQRVEFKCGGRSLADFRAKNQILTQVAGSLSVGWSELDQAINRIQAERQNLRKRLSQTQNRVTTYEAIELDSNAQERGTFRVITGVWSDRDPADLRALAKKLAIKPGTVVLLASSGKQPIFVFARAIDLSLDIVPLLRSAIERTGGRGGGGKADFAQGGGPPASEEQVRTVIQSIRDQLVD